MSAFIPVKRPVIRNQHLGDHRVVEPTIATDSAGAGSPTVAFRYSGVGRSSRWKTRSRKHRWLPGVMAVALLAVVAWADVPEAQGRLPEPRTGDEAPFVLDDHAVTPRALDFAKAPTPTPVAAGTESRKVDGVKLNPYADPPAAPSIRKATGRKRPKPGPMNYYKVDAPKANPYR